MTKIKPVYIRKMGAQKWRKVHVFAESQYEAQKKVQSIFAEQDKDVEVRGAEPLNCEPQSKRIILRKKKKILIRRKIA